MIPFAGPFLFSSSALTTTLLAGDQDSTVTLSGGGLTATKNGTTGNNSYAFGGSGKSSGKWRFQYRIDVFAAEVSVGICGALFVNRHTWPGAANDAVVLNGGGGSNGVITSAVTQYSAGGLAAGDIIDVYADVDAARVWFAKNGVIINGDPAAGTGGTLMSNMRKAWYPVVWLMGANTAVTMNFGATPFSVAGVSGFDPWSVTTPPASHTQFRSLAILVRSNGFFSHGFAELEVMTAPSGSNILSGATGSSNAAITGGTFAAGIDGSTATGVTVGNTGVQNQLPAYFAYELGANATRNAAYMAVRGLPGGGGSEQQAPRLFDVWVSAGPTATGPWFKTKLGVTLSAFTATTPGERKEFTL